MSNVDDISEKVLDAIAAGLQLAEGQIDSMVGAFAESSKDAIIIGVSIGKGSLAMAHAVADSFGIARERYTEAELRKRMRKPTDR